MKKKKRILIGLPQSFSLHKILQQNLEALGFDVINISYQEHIFNYENFGQRTYNFIRKTFFRDRHYKNKLKFRAYGQVVEKILKKIDDPVDYALIIRGDVYPKNILRLIKSKSKKLIGYQWDGLQRFPAIFSYIKFFDRFHVFDPNDFSKYSKKYPLLPLTNFYYENSQYNPNKVNSKEVFFIGTFMKSRMANIISFADILCSLGFTPNFMIFVKDGFTEKKEKYSRQGIHFTDQHMSYEQTLEMAMNAAVLTDFLNTVHNGLSFRVFEALGMDKKLITTNVGITKYDFYHPDNIYVINEKNIDGLKYFLEKPYHPIDIAIKEKYSFKNWINYVLELGSFIPIDLPKN